MKRRRFLGAAGAAGATAAMAVAAAPAIAQSRREVRLVTAWPADFPGFSTSAERLAKRITLLTGGTLAVKVFPAGELVSAFESFDAVATGKAEMYHAFESYWEDRSPAFSFFASVPFGLTPQELSAWIHESSGQALWDDLSANFNIKPLLAGTTGTQMGGWFKKEVRSVEDLRGLRIAITGLGGAVMRRIGAVAVALPGREIAAALREGGIDAAKWFGPWHGLALGLHEVAKYYYYPGIHEPGIAFALGINREFWNSLSLSQREAVVAAAESETVLTQAEFDAGSADALDVLKRNHFIEPRKMPDDVLIAIGEAAGQVVAEAAAFDATTRAVYEAYIAYRQKSVAWSKLSIQAYMDARLLPFRYSR